MKINKRTKIETVTEVDKETGEVLSVKETSFRIRVPQEDYCKLYFDTVLPLTTKGYMVLICLLKFMNYSNRVSIDAEVKQYIFETVTISPIYFRKIVHELTRSNVMVKIGTSAYMIHPKIASKVSETKLKELIAAYNFKKI